jgi:hypothetical protein
MIPSKPVATAHQPVIGVFSIYSRYPLNDL